MWKKYTLLLGKVSTVCYFVFLKCMQTEKEQGDFLTTPSKQVLTRDVSQAADCMSNNVQYFHGYTRACCYALFPFSVSCTCITGVNRLGVVCCFSFVLMKTFPV